MNLGNLYEDFKDYGAALEYYERGLRGKEQALGKYHPDTLDTIMCIAFLHMDGLKDFTKAEELYRKVREFESSTNPRYCF